MTGNFLRLAGLALALALVWPGGAAPAAEHLTSSPEAVARLAELVASAERPESHRARDRYRHPLETLAFLGLEPGLTVVEIWPGGQGGWYRRILEPFLGGAGAYVPVLNRSAFPGRVEGVPYGQADMVLVFRAHGFMIYRRPAQDHVNALFEMLRPGGILGIVDHAGDEAVPQDPGGRSGYVNESHFRTMAEKAGFRFLAASDVNRNPRDTKDHPRGVYSLPPSLRGSRGDEGLRAKMLAVGESDRFTLKFYKPGD